MYLASVLLSALVLSQEAPVVAGPVLEDPVVEVPVLEVPVVEVPVLEAPEEISLQKISLVGSGCFGPDDYSIQPGAEGKILSLAFNNFVAELGPSVAIKENRKNCSISISLAYPDGWQFRLASFEQKGYEEVSAGVKAELSLNYTFQGAGKSDTLKVEKVGPHANAYVYKDQVSGAAVAFASWSPCHQHRDLILTPSARLSKVKGAKGLLQGLQTVDELSVGLVWRKCP